MKPAGYQYLIWAISLAMQIALLVAFSSGNNLRLYRVAAIYIVVLLITTLTDVSVRTLTDDRRAWYVLYWCGEVIRQSAMFAVIVDLTARYMREHRARRIAVSGLIAGAAAFWGVSLLVHQDDRLNDWMGPVVRDLSFGTAVLAMMLWARMIRHEHREARDLALAGGLGLQMTGEAMAQSLRIVLPEGLQFGAAWLTVISHFLCLLVWWQAFARRSRNEPPKPGSSKPDTGSGVRLGSLVR